MPVLSVHTYKPEIVYPARIGEDLGIGGLWWLLYLSVLGSISNYRLQTWLQQNETDAELHEEYYCLLR